MIPDDAMIQKMWDTYELPLHKRIHCEMVDRVALILAKRIQVSIPVNEHLLHASCLLHDIDKNIEKLAGEHHPDAGVRVLNKEGMTDVADVIRTHPLHTILDDLKAPKTIEQQLVYLADKMSKDTCIGVEKRFEIWRKEDVDDQSQNVLKAAYPKVIALRDTLLEKAGISQDELIKLTE